ncbi:uncharacterized protein LOC117505395 [Thalassophryne amazonica]|uniref:uncharacterized protein LOC117505395 n=1 Tax=Thalassophryne amazonica TaxID=390379 RepID=UPI001470EA4D|nr:uncharacterized protein LOC117505395 [Thalassophryne amazonica]
MELERWLLKSNGQICPKISCTKLVASCSRRLAAKGCINKVLRKGGDTVIEKNSFNQELEDIIRTVLGDVDRLQPFTSAHFIVYPYKTRWEGISEVMIRHKEEEMMAYPFILTLYLEKKTQRGKKLKEKRKPEKPARLPFSSEVPPKRIKSNSPLEGSHTKGLYWTTWRPRPSMLWSSLWSPTIQITHNHII